MTNLPARKQKSGDQLAVGDWLAPNELLDGAAEVLFAHAYPASADRSRDNSGKHVQLVVREQGRVTTYADVIAGNMLFDLATEEDLAELREQAERTAFAAGLRAFADWVEANPWAPFKRPGSYRQNLHHQIDLHGVDQDAKYAAVARVREVAARLGVTTEEAAERTDATIEIGSVSYSVIAWHRDGRPAEPEPGPETCLGAGMDCGRPLPCPDHPRTPAERIAAVAEVAPEFVRPAPAGPVAEHFEVGGWKGDGPGSCGVECECGVTFDGFDSLAEAAEELALHIADPAGLAFSRAVEADDPTPVSPARGLPPQTGAVLSAIAGDGHKLGETGRPRDRRTCVDPGDQEHDHEACRDANADADA